MLKKILTKIRCYFSTHRVITLDLRKGKITYYIPYSGIYTDINSTVYKYKCLDCGKEFCTGKLSNGKGFYVSLESFNY